MQSVVILSGSFLRDTMPSVVILCAVMFCVVTLCVILLNVVAPKTERRKKENVGERCDQTLITSRASTIKLFTATFSKLACSSVTDIDNLVREY